MPKSFIENEPELITLFKTGDHAAFQYIYEKFQANLFLKALRLLDNQAEAEDITAETFVKLWKTRSSFNSIPAMGSWLAITNRNAALDILKHRKIVETTRISLQAAEDPAQEEWTNTDLFAEALREIYKQIELLPDKSRQVFKLRYIEGLRNEEIALQLDIHNQSVRDHLSRALKTLRIAILKKENLFSFFLLWLNTK